MIDECHLLWGDISGYVWGQTSKRISIPVVNARYKQTYFGALDYRTKEFIIYEAEKGDSTNTINFLESLQSQRPGAKVLIIWDGASASPLPANPKLFRLLKSGVRARAMVGNL